MDVKLKERSAPERRQVTGSVAGLGEKYFSNLLATPLKSSASAGGPLDFRELFRGQILFFLPSPPPSERARVRPSKNK